MAAVLIVAVAAIVRWATGPYVVRFPFVTFYPAVMISGIYGGIGSGLAATGLSALLAGVYFMEPIGKFWIDDPGNWLILGIFLTTCVLLSYISELMFRGIARAKEAEAQVKLAAEREKAAAVIQEREELFGTLADNMAQFAWMADEKGRMFWYNKRWYDYTGTTLEEMKGWGWTKLEHPDHVERVVSRIQKSWDTGEPWEDVFPLRGKDGEYRWFLSRALPIRNDAGQIVRWFGTNTDITEQREIEAALRERERELKQAHDELDLRVQERTKELLKANDVLKEQAMLLDLAHDAIFVRDSESRVIYWNKGAERTYGWKAGEAFGKTTNELLKTKFPIPLEEIESILAAKNEWQGELIHTTNRNVPIVVESRWALQRDCNGSPVNYLEINRDVTSRKMAEASMQKYAKRLERSNQVLQDFAFVASHDLQEPLRKIVTFGDLLKKRYGEGIPRAGVDYLDKILGAADRMNSLLQSLLAYSRVTTRTEPFVHVDLRKVVKDVVLDLEVPIHETGAEIEIGFLPCIQADPSQMRQLFQNLMGNSLKFYRQGEPPHIKIYGNPCWNGTCEIYVQDNGIGFDESLAEKIFAPFQRLHGKSSPYKGSGMGLAICRKIVDRHNGSITAKSTEGKGSTFIITLPLMQCEQNGLSRTESCAA